MIAVRPEGMHRETIHVVVVLLHSSLRELIAQEDLELQNAADSLWERRS